MTNRIYTVLLTASLLVIGTIVAHAQAPTTSSGFRMYNSATENITIKSGSHGGTGTFFWPLPAEGIFTSDASGNMAIETFDDLFADLTLNENALLIGDASNNPTELASPGAGGSGSILTVGATGTPEWTSNPGGLLPAGTGDNNTLAWDATNGVWVESSNLTTDPVTGEVTMSSLGTSTAPDATGGGLLITDAAGNVTEISVDNVIGNATLTEDNLWLGDASNNPAELTPGTDGQVLRINGTTPTWETINVLPTGTADNSTLVWDATNSVWVESTNLTSDPVSGEVTMPSLGTSTAPDATGGGLLITDNAGNVTEISVDDIIGASTLTQNSLWVGDATNNPDELATTNVEGAVLTQDATGAPQWTANPGGLLPAGTGDNNTLAWDATNGVWVESSNLTTDPVTGEVTMSSLGTSTAPDATGGGLLITDAAGNVTEISVDDVIGNATLTEDNLWLGDASNNPAELTPGTDGQVLRINGTTPTWETINVLPTGTADNSTLVWDATNSVWVESTNLTSDPVSGEVTMPSLGTSTAPDATGGGLLITDNAGNVTEISVDDIIGASTLTQNSLWVGDATNNPDELATTNVEGAVLTQDATGAPQWTANPGGLLPEGTSPNSVLVWDNTAGEWVENTNVTADPTTGDVATSGDLTADGDVTLGDASTDAVTINGETVVVPNLPTSTTPDATGGGLLITDNAGNVTEISVDDVVGNATLSENAIWVGDASDNPGELASSGTQGDILTVNASGTPTWTTPVGVVQAQGTVVGTGTFSYTVTPTGVNPTGRVIVVTPYTTTGLLTSFAISGTTATTFTVDFSVGLGASEGFHWVVY